LQVWLLLTEIEKNCEFFSRYLHACRSVWIGLPTFLQEQENALNPSFTTEYELPELLLSHLDVKAGFTLTDPNDPRYQKVAKSRHLFGEVVLHAAAKFRNNTNSEDHIDAVIGVVRAIDTCLLDYALGRADFDAIQKNYTQAREFVSLYLMILTIDNLSRIK
jgi:proteasome activator subunit 4